MPLRRPPSPSIRQLSTRVELQSKSATAIGGAGGTGMAESYSTVGRAWCAIELLRGGRYVSGVQTDDAATHRVTLRYRDDFPLWRYILDGSRRLRVLTIGDPDGGHQWLVATCEELTP